MNLIPPGGSVVSSHVFDECQADGTSPSAYVKYATDAAPEEVRMYYRERLPEFGFLEDASSSPDYYYGEVDGTIRVRLLVEALDSTPGVVSLYGTIVEAEACPSD